MFSFPATPCIGMVCNTLVETDLLNTTVSSTIVSRGNLDFPLYTIHTVSRCEKYGNFKNTVLLVERYCRNSTKRKI
jgi:hypothetical protein